MTASEPVEAYRDKPGDCHCRYPWRLFATGTNHAKDCPAHERICRERAATASPATPFPVGSKVLIRIGHDPEARVEGLVLGVAGDERWVQVGHETFVHHVSMLHPDGPEPDPAGDVGAIATGVTTGRGEAQPR
jgi:hypothetical protein